MHEHMKQIDSNPNVSVIIPSYNSAPHIRQCLNALQSQITTCSYEVILVDSSQDETREIVTEEFPGVRLFHFHERCSVGKARNIGVEKARGEIVLFLDTDCIPEPTWIHDMSHAIQRHEVDGVGGGVENGTPTNLMGSIGFYLEFFRFLAHKGTPYQTPFVMGGNSGFRRAVCQSLPFNNLSVGDDFLFAWKLVQQKKELLFLPSAAVRHMNKTGFRKVLGYQYQLGRGACFYRQSVSPKLSSFFERFPLAIFLTPPLVMCWISFIVLKRRHLTGWIKFVPLVPLLLFAHFVWASGFFRELLNHRYSNQHVIKRDHKAAMATSDGL